MTGIESLVDALALAIEAKKGGRIQETVTANRRVEDAFIAAMTSAMKEVFHSGAMNGHGGFREAVLKAYKPGRSTS